ncbi:MAG: hypothetical protein ACQZ3M_00095 [cyanobacterium endosymbiont of Rhopalodia fuxianensis]
MLSYSLFADDVKVFKRLILSIDPLCQLINPLHKN